MSCGLTYTIAFSEVAHERIAALEREGGTWLQLYLECIPGTYKQYQRLKRLTYPFDERIRTLAHYQSTRNVKLRIQQLYHDLQDWKNFGDRDRASFGDDNYSLLHLLLMATLADGAPETEFTELVDIIRRAISPACKARSEYFERELYYYMNERQYHTALCRRLDRLIRTSEDELVVALASRLLHEATLQEEDLPCEVQHSDIPLGIDHFCACTRAEVGERMSDAIDSLNPDFHVDALLLEMAKMIADAEDADPYDW